MQVSNLKQFRNFLIKKKQANLRIELNLNQKKGSQEKKKKLEKVVLIQALIRGFLVRKRLRAPKDHITFDMIYQQLSDYNIYIKHGIEINKQLGRKHKLIRKANFPSHISENIIKYYLLKKFGIMADWGYAKPGDLTILNKRVEVKAGQLGPTSFGPTETWDLLYFINCKNHLTEMFTIYFINIKNTHPVFQNLKVNQTQTYQDQCLQGRRPRLNFSNLKEQLGEKYCQLVFEAKLEELRPT